MPKISIPIKDGLQADSIKNMAEALGRLTGTAVECQVALNVTANDAVIGALKHIAPMAKLRRSRRIEPPAGALQPEPAAPAPAEVPA